MKRVAVIFLVCYACYVLEFLLYNFWGAWGKPELLMLAVTFFNLYLGIRFGIIAAVICGLMKDASGIAPLGTYTFVYLAGAYVIILARQYLYQPGSRFSRAVVAFFMVLGCFMVQAVLTNMDHEARLGDLFIDVLVPQLVTTMIAATWVFAQLKKISAFFALKKPSS